MEQARRKIEVAKLLGEEPRTVQYLVDSGVGTPETAPPSGKRGKPYLFSEKNLLELAFSLVLKDEYGVRLGIIKDILDTLRVGKTKKTGRAIGNFFTSEEWGHKRELLYAFRPMGVGDFEIVDKTAQGRFEVPELFFRSRIEAGGAVTFLMLGSVKRKALKRIGKG